MPQTTTIEIYTEDWRASKAAQDPGDDHKDIIREWRQAYEQQAEHEDELEADA